MNKNNNLENTEDIEVFALNEDGTRYKTDQLIKRSTPLKQGLYVIGINNWIVNYNGDFIIQKRAYTKRNNPGKWSSTNGLRGVGESSIEACIRETKEELGINIKEHQIIPVEKSKIAGDNLLVDIFVTVIDININDIVIQQEEVEEVKILPLKEVLTLDISTTCEYIKQIGEKINTKASDQLKKIRENK